MTLPETHPIRKEQKAVVKVDYKFGDVNRLSNRVTGKGKRVTSQFNLLVTFSAPVK